MTQTVYDAAGGADGLLRLAHAWHERCLADPVAAHPFEHPGHPQHLERLAAYWGEALGGPPAYTEGMGDETRVQRMHAGNGVHHELDERAIACFEVAVADAGLADDDRLRTTLVTYFRWATEQLSQHPDTHTTVPKGLPLPRWDWDGPVG
ncbi:group II truncated hemoglobin [Angustibacter peucedani]